MKMQRKEVMAIATLMFIGGSVARFQTSGLGWFFPNQMKYGTLSPVCRKVPAEASNSRKPTQSLCSSKPAETIIDLLTNPLKSGKAEMDRPPIKVKTKVQGIFFYNPPSSVNLLSPVMCRTEPQPIKSRPL